MLWRYLRILGALVVLAVALRITTGISTGMTLAALLVGWPLVGTLVTGDDNLPGGWSNPDGKYVPEGKKLWWWADLLLVRGSIVVIAFAVEDAIAAQATLGPWVIAAAMMLVGLPIFARGAKREAANAV